MEYRIILPLTLFFIILQLRLFNNLIFTNALSVDIGDIYSNIELANTSVCLEKLTRVPLRYYEFKYDPGRRHLGSLGSELEGVLPEAVELVRSRVYPNPDKTPGAPATVKAEEIKVVDKSTIFMLGVGATKELITRQKKARQQVDYLLQQDDQLTIAFVELEKRLAREADAQVKERLSLAKAELSKAQLEGEVEKRRLEEASRTKEVLFEEEKRRLEQQDRLLRMRMEAENEAERNRTLVVLKMQEESLQKREELRTKTELELQHAKIMQDQDLEKTRLEIELTKVKAEASAKAQAERENEDILMRRVRAEGEERRRQIQEGISSIFTHLTSGIGSFTSDPTKIRTFVGVAIAVTAGYFIVKEGATLLRQVIESQLGKPRLVRETSHKRSIFPFSTLSLFSKQQASVHEGMVKAFEGVILCPKIMEQVIYLATATKNARANGAPFRHLLLYGPPGTGKTMVAKRLAKCSGMDYAIMSGGDVGPLRQDAVTELHKLFRWASRSRQGLLLFVDEAESFLGQRSQQRMSEDQRNALNALLFHTGTQGNNFMMVLATNRAEDLDSAILDRVDDSLLFPLPGLDERKLLVEKYFKDYVVRSTNQLKGVISGYFLNKIEYKIDKDIDEKCLSQVAEITEGFSGREIAKLMLSIQNAMNGSETNTADKKLIDKVTLQKIEEHQQKKKMKRNID